MNSEPCPRPTDTSGCPDVNPGPSETLSDKPEAQTKSCPSCRTSRNSRAMLPSPSLHHPWPQEIKKHGKRWIFPFWGNQQPVVWDPKTPPPGRDSSTESESPHQSTFRNHRVRPRSGSPEKRARIRGVNVDEDLTQIRRARKPLLSYCQSVVVSGRCPAVEARLVISGAICYLTPAGFLTSTPTLSPNRPTRNAQSLLETMGLFRSN